MVYVSYLLMTVLGFSGLFLIGLILLQRGRGGGLAGAFGGMGGQSAFGTKAGDVFTKITIGVATAWILLCGTSVIALHSTTRLGKDVGRQEGTEIKNPETGSGTLPKLGESLPLDDKNPDAKPSDKEKEKVTPVDPAKEAEEKNAAEAGPGAAAPDNKAKTEEPEQKAAEPEKDKKADESAAKPDEPQKPAADNPAEEKKPE